MYPVYHGGFCSALTCNENVLDIIPEVQRYPANIWADKGFINKNLNLVNVLIYIYGQVDPGEAGVCTTCGRLLPHSDS